jgi:hypothetical protein
MDQKTESEIRGEIIDFLGRFKVKISNLSYDGVPVWWFYELRFTCDSLMKPMPSHKEIAEAIYSSRKKDFFGRARFSLLSYALRKFIRLNEEVKIRVSRFNKNKSGQKNSGKKRVMFLAHTNYLLPDEKCGYSIDRIGSILKLVREDNELEDYVSFIDPLSYRTYLRLLKYENLAYSYIDKDIRKRAKKASKNIAGKWRETRGKLVFSGRDKQIFDELVGALDVFFSGEFLYVTLLYYETYKKIMQKEEIRILCFDSGTNIISRCAIAAADRTGAKSLHVMHGTAIPLVPLEKPDSFYVAAIGERYREAYIKCGMKPERVVVTGPVFMDEIVHYIGKRNKKTERKKILLATTTWVEDREGELQTYTDYIGKFLRETYAAGDVDIFLKLHPREKDSSVYQRIIESGSYKGVKVIPCSGETQTKRYIYGLLTEMDVVFSFISTLSTESMAIGIPAPLIGLSSKPLTDPILSDGRLLHLNADANLTELCGKIFHGEEYRKNLLGKQNEVINEFFYKVDGKAAERVVELMKRISG